MDSRTEEILNRFRDSWTKTLDYYSNLINNNTGFERLIPLYLFIQKLKQSGEDDSFRLDRSWQNLVFSRSVDTGLRRDQKFIKVEVMDDSYEITLRDGSKMYRQYRIKDLEDARLANLLQTLKDTLAD